MQLLQRWMHSLGARFDVGDVGEAVQEDGSRCDQTNAEQEAVHGVGKMAAGVC